MYSPYIRLYKSRTSGRCRNGKSGLGNETRERVEDSSSSALENSRNAEMRGQTERSSFFLTLGGENRRTTRLSPGLPENVKKSVRSQRSSAFIGAPLDSRWKDYEMRKGSTRK